jgi:hypothetical protein
MHALAGTLALARRNQEIIRSTIVTEAELAVSADGLISFVDSIELSKKELPFFFSLALIPAELHHAVFHSSQLYDVA